MKININNLVSISEANQNFSKVARLVDENGAEDIIVSKIIRLEQKDIEDIDELMDIANKELINLVINEVLLRDDLYEFKKNQFIKRLLQFRERYYV
jgi:hypothetical protein